MNKRAQRILRGLLLSLAVVGLSAAAVTVQAAQPPTADHTGNEPSAGMMAFDLLLVRPLSLVATVVGTGLFIVDLPLSVFQKDAPAAPFHQLVVNPMRYTFTRPLGALN